MCENEKKKGRGKLQKGWKKKIVRWVVASTISDEGSDSYIELKQ
jgi:hypothetical protein